MKEFNLKRVLEASYTDKFSNNENDAIFDYLIEIDIDLNEFNVDDFLINGLMYVTQGEYKADKDNYSVIYNDKKEDVLVISQ